MADDIRRTLKTSSLLVAAAIGATMLYQNSPSVRCERAKGELADDSLNYSLSKMNARVRGANDEFYILEARHADKIEAVARHCDD